MYLKIGDRKKSREYLSTVLPQANTCFNMLSIGAKMWLVTLTVILKVSEAQMPPVVSAASAGPMMVNVSKSSLKKQMSKKKLINDDQIR